MKPPYKKSRQKTEETVVNSRSGPSHSRLDEAASALSRVLTFEYPADAVLSRYFRDRLALGQQDRAFVAESVFGVLRRKLLLEQPALPEILELTH